MTTIPLEQHQAVVEALHAQHRTELTALMMKLTLYRAALVDAGVEPPTADADDVLQMWRTCAAVISTASAFVDHLGTSKELVDGLDGKLGRTLGRNSPAASAA